MIKKFASLIRRILGRVNKVKLIRDILLIVLVALLSFFMPAYIELFKGIDNQTVNDLLKQPVFYLAIILPIAMLGLLMFFMHKIDNWENVEANDQHDEIITELQNVSESINNLISEIRQDRNERNNQPKPKTKV